MSAVFNNNQYIDIMFNKPVRWMQNEAINPYYRF